MWRRLILGLQIVFCAGCASQAPDVALGAPQVSVNQSLDLAGRLEPSKIGIYKDQDSVKVGDSWEKAKQVFPASRGAYDFYDLPPPIPRKYEAHGWETPKGEGFGVITLDGGAVLAMYQLEHAKQDTVLEMEKAQQDHIGDAPTVVSGRSVTYWFWSDPAAHQTLMVCALATSADLNLTIATGDDNVLQRLGISVEAARRKANQVDQSPPKLLAPNQK